MSLTSLVARWLAHWRRRPVPPRVVRRGCSRRCREATTPVRTCRCVCGGTAHGTQRRDRLWAESDEDPQETLADS